MGLLLVVAGYLAFVLIHGTITEYQPSAEAPVEVVQQSSQTSLTDSVYTLITWNVGYGGLGAESDFFYETNAWIAAGKRVRPPRRIVEKNVAGITQFLRHTRADFFLLQEIDRGSRRSWHLDLMDSVRREQPEYFAGYAPNYRVARVPVPVLEPWRAYGQVESGLATLSRFQPQESIRTQLPGDYSWPMRLFSLDRCAAIHRYTLVDREAELVVVNLHNSAYDDGSLKTQQMNFLRKLFMAEYARGNYVIAGGDWNLCPPYFRYDGFMPGQSGSYRQQNIEADLFPPDWQWIYDPTQPTNRKVQEPFVPGETFVTLIDFFLVSPNVRVLEVKGLGQGFQYSDHQPVYMEVQLQ